jgi:hypothetical protein
VAFERSYDAFNVKADRIYRIWVFPLAAATAVLITFLTVGFHAVKAAIAGPVESLRTE